MIVVVNLETLDRDGKKIPSNNPTADSLSAVTHVQLRYDDHEDPNIIQLTNVSGENSTFEGDVDEDLLIWDNFKLFTSEDGTNYTENKTWGGTNGKPLTNSNLTASDYSAGEVPMSDGNDWIPTKLNRFTIYEIAQTGEVYNLNDNHFISSSVGWICGAGGHILKTTNGTSYSELTSGTSNDLNGIFFIDANTGWAVGASGKIIKTTDGGANWSSLTSGTSNSLNAVYFISSTVGWAVGNLVVLRTTDGGSNWTANGGGFGANFTGVWATSTSNVFFVSTGTKLYTSTDGGATINAGSTDIFGSGISCTSIMFVSSSVGFIAGGNTSAGKIAKTTDSGANWTTVFSGSEAFKSISVVGSTGWAVGENGYVVKTTDTGSTWTAQTSRVEDYSYNLTGVITIDSSNAKICGSDYVILSTTNGTGFSAQATSTGRPVLIDTLYNGAGITLQSPYPFTYLDAGHYQINNTNTDIGTLLVQSTPLFSSGYAKTGDVVANSLMKGSSPQFTTLDTSGNQANDILSSSALIWVWDITT